MLGQNPPIIWFLQIAALGKGSKLKIIKYCDENYSYLKTDRIQVGTLDYFRNHDNNFIADPNEGTGGPYSIQPKSSPSGLSQGLIDQFGGGIVCIGALPSDSIISVQPGGTVNLNKRFKFPNVYIFCCSYEEHADKKTAEGLGYNSWYEIIDPSKFMKEIQNGFHEVAKLKFEGPIETKSILIHGLVNYSSREDQVFENEFDLLTNLLFTKPKVSKKDSTVSFEDNKEYRFVWLFKNAASNEIMEVQEPPILVRNTDALKTTLK